jgi:23S rRNA pseudouridine2605 synthase
LLLTNDGGLARALELPETGWLRRYRVRAFGQVTQEQLDQLRGGLTIDGVQYGPIEATLDRMQGANAWLTFAIREGKNREVRNVLGALGLQVNRLIRVSFGPFQLAELPAGDVEEVKTRILREQLGERLARSAGCDFSAPVIERVEEREAADPTHVERRDQPSVSSHAAARETADAHGRGNRQQHRREGGRPGRPHFGKQRALGQGSRGSRSPDAERPRAKHRPKSGSVWRDYEARGKAPSRRKFHGSRRDAGPAAELDASAEKQTKRAGLLSDRKGRRILVERFGNPPQEEPSRLHERASKYRKKPPRRDRSGGPRPSRPKGR